MSLRPKAWTCAIVMMLFSVSTQSATRIPSSVESPREGETLEDPTQENPVVVPVRAASSPELRFFSDNLENAINKLGSEPSFSLENPADLNDMGFVYLYFGRYAEAEERFRQALQLRPGFGPALLNMGVSAYRRGDPLEAARWFQRTEKTDPSGPDAAFNLAALALERGDPSEAIRRLEAVVRVWTEEPDVWNNLGCAYYQSGRWLEAFQSFVRSKETGADYYEASINLGQAAYKTGKFSDAREAAERAVGISPLAPEGHNLAGLAFLGQGQTPKAVLAFARAVSLGRGNAGYWNNLGRSQMALDLESEAEQAFKKALSLRPGLKAAQWNLADLRLKQGRSNEALPLYEKARDTPGAEKSGAFHYNWGAACARTGDSVKARRLWEKTLELDPGHAGALYALADLEKTDKRSGPAREYSRRGKALYPSDPRWERLFGDLERMDGQDSKALDHYKRARKMGDTAPDLERKIQALENPEPPPAISMEPRKEGETPEEVRRQVQAFWDRGENETALDLAVRAAEKQARLEIILAHELIALKTLSDAHRILGHREEAYRALETAVKRAPQDPALRLETANLAFEQGRFARSENHFKMALMLDPGSREAALGLGSALFKQYKVEEARVAKREGDTSGSGGILLQPVARLPGTRSNGKGARGMRERPHD